MRKTKKIVKDNLQKRLRMWKCTRLIRWDLVFTAHMILFAMKVSIGNAFLDWRSYFRYIYSATHNNDYAVKGRNATASLFFTAGSFACTLLLADWFK